MTKSRDMIIEECERTPNRYTSKALFGVLIALFAACILNELKLFAVDRLMIWICFVMSGLYCLIARHMCRNEKICSDKRTKFVLLTLALVETLAVSVFLNISIVLLLLLPMLLATQYRSTAVSVYAVIGSCICCICAPLLAWLANAWSLNIMTGYLENACRVAVTGFEPSVRSTGEMVLNLVLYHILPQLMVIALYSFVFLGITKNNISGLRNRLRVMMLRDDLSRELTHVMEIQDKMIFSLADIIENRDTTTGGHVKRTSQVVELIVRAMHDDPEQHLSDDFCNAVVKASPLHDLGKISIDDAILRKPGKLTDDERALILRHPAIGANLVRDVLNGIENEEFIEIAVNLAMYHHEWYNGSGYPAHLKGERIPLEARIMAIADVYDALVSERSYKQPLPPDAAFDIIEEAMGSQFDPNLNRYFVKVRPQIERFYAEK